MHTNPALAGFFFGVDETPLWVQGMVAGNGLIALALTTFATRRPARVLLGAASGAAWRCARCRVIAQRALRAISALGFWSGSARRRQLLD